MYRKINRFLVLFAVMALVCLAAGIAAAATITPSFTYQGKLTNATGSPLTGTYSVTFKLYDVASGGTALATDTHTVTATNGLFTTAIAVNSAGLVDGRALWLGIKVGTDPEMTPRQEIRPVPYALGLRTGTVIAGDSSSLFGLMVSHPTYGLIAQSTDSGGRGLSAGAFGENSVAGYFYASEKGSKAIQVRLLGNYSDGVFTDTYGTRANGLVSYTHGPQSTGLYTETYGQESPGVRILTHGLKSPAISATNANTNSDLSPVGIMAEATGNDGIGLIAKGERGIWAESTRDTGPALIAWRGPAGGLAADFQGNVRISKYEGSGRYGTAVMELGEGLDYAEGFNVSRAAEVMPGMVLVIDRDNPGTLRASTEPYDHKVAGIVSGARDLGSAVKVGGEQFDENVALAGRVYCNVDAGYGAVEAGDLLTTSATPGYAMVVKDYNQAQGAILGKAMERLGEGQKGQILVLVTLQ